MSFREQATQRIKESSSRSSSRDTGPEPLEQIDVDMANTPYVKFYPTTLVTGVFPADEGNPIIRVRDPDNNDGRTDQGYLLLVLDDLEVITDADEGMENAEFVVTGDSDSTAYRVVNLDDEGTSLKFDGQGIDINGDTYDRTDSVTEIDGRAFLVVDRSAATSVAKTLDVNGATPAGMDSVTGRPNTGLIERKPDDVDDSVYQRYARPTVELREDLLGARVGILVQRRAEADDGFTGYVGEEGNPATDEPVLPVPDDVDTVESHSDRNRASFAELVAADERRDMMWYTVFNMDTGEVLEPIEGEASRQAFLEWSFDPKAAHLPDEDWDFVQQYTANGGPTDEEKIRMNIEHNSDKLSDDPNVERMIYLIQKDAEWRENNN